MYIPSFKHDLGYFRRYKKINTMKETIFDPLPPGEDEIILIDDPELNEIFTAYGTR